MTVMCEPAVLEESLIMEEDFNDIKVQLVSWTDG